MTINIRYRNPPPFRAGLLPVATRFTVKGNTTTTQKNSVIGQLRKTIALEEQEAKKKAAPKVHFVGKLVSSHAKADSEVKENSAKNVKDAGLKSVKVLAVKAPFQLLVTAPDRNSARTQVTMGDRPTISPVSILQEETKLRAEAMTFQVAIDLAFAEIDKDKPNVQFLMKLIAQFPAVVNQQRDDGNTMLHLIILKNQNAAQLTNADIYLFKHIVEKMSEKAINSYNELGTPLHNVCVAKVHHEVFVKLLLQRSADPTLLDHCNDDILSYRRLSPQILNLIHDALNQRVLNRSIKALPTLDELTAQYGNKELAYNMYWAAQAVRHVRYECVIGAPNNLKDPAKTNDWSNLIADLGIAEFKKFVPTRAKAWGEYIHRRSELLKSFRSGDCYVQASAAFVYLQGKKIPRVEYFGITRKVNNKVDQTHHFVVIGRDPMSDPQNPMTWGGAICDPWLNITYPSNEFFMFREFYQNIGLKPDLYYPVRNPINTASK